MYVHIMYTVYLKEDSNNSKSILLNHCFLKQAVLVRVPVDQVELRTHTAHIPSYVSRYVRVHIYSMRLPNSYNPWQTHSVLQKT